jgi:hypothetical protein
MLKFEVDALDGLEEATKALYQPHGNKFRLAVEGLDPADELKEALRKEREERAAAKAKLKEFEDRRVAEENDRLTKAGEFEALYKKATESASTTAKELQELKDKIATKEREATAAQIAGGLTRDTARAELLKKEALRFVQYTPEGVKINGEDGAALTVEQLGKALATKYPFLVDGNQASGGGANGTHNNGGAMKKFTEYSAAELSVIRKDTPETYDRLLSEHQRSKA